MNVIGRGKRSKALSEVMSVKNINKFSTDMFVSKGSHSYT